MHADLAPPVRPDRFAVSMPTEFRYAKGQIPIQTPPENLFHLSPNRPSSGRSTRVRGTSIR